MGYTNGIYKRVLELPLSSFLESYSDHVEIIIEDSMEKLRQVDKPRNENGYLPVHTPERIIGFAFLLVLLRPSDDN